jgi:hypothetical protein
LEIKISFLSSTCLKSFSLTSIQLFG